MQATRTNIKNIGKAEFMSLCHQYHGESLCSIKLSIYSNQCQDPAMKNLINQMSAQCQDRANRLSSLLQKAAATNSFPESIRAKGLAEIALYTSGI